MKFNKPLVRGVLLKRYKRFFADVEVKGEKVTAHVPNTGSMKSCSEPGSECAISESDNPDRKLKFTLEMVKTPQGSWVGVNTSNPNKLVVEAFLNKTFSHWKEFHEHQSEVKISPESRIDLVLKKNRPDGTQKLHYVEIKNVTLNVNGVAQFPDAVSARALKHVNELLKLIEKGHTAEILFVIQREDCQSFSPAFEIDPEYSQALLEAEKKGLRVSPFVCRVSPEVIVLTDTKLVVLSKP